MLPTGLAWLGVATGAIGIVSELLRPVLGGAYALYGLLLFLWLTGKPSRSGGSSQRPGTRRCRRATEIRWSVRPTVISLRFEKLAARKGFCGSPITEGQATQFCR